MNPRAWQALSHASEPCEDESSFAPVQAPPPQLPAGLDWAGPTESGVDVQSGMAPRFSPRALEAMRLVRDGETDVLFTDSFKTLTRNPHKLCRIIDFVLAHGGVFLTCNYYLSAGYVARRRTLLRPVHSTDDIAARCQDPAGLTERHREMLLATRQQLF